MASGSHITLQGLIEKDILATDAGEEYVQSPSLDSEIKSKRTEFQRKGSHASSASANLPDEVIGNYPTFAAIFSAVDERLGDRPIQEVLKIAVIVSQIDTGRAAVEGVPTGFLPVSAKELEPVMAIIGHSIVYVWQQDCDPCDILKQDFNAIFDTYPEACGLLAIEGPSNATALYESFDVAGAPTVLFCRGTSVITRLTGARDREVLRTEVQELCETASTSDNRSV